MARYETRLVTTLGPGYYPDALIPLDGPEADRLPGLPVAVPARDNPVRGQRVAAFWVDVRVPRDAEPGTPFARLFFVAIGSLPYC